MQGEAGERLSLLLHCLSRVNDRIKIPISHSGISNEGKRGKPMLTS